MIKRLKPQLVAGTLLAVFLIVVFPAPVAAQNAPFYDLPENHWAYNSVRELANLGILTGYPDGRFDGTRAATRYEVSVIAARLLEYASGNIPTSGGTAAALSKRLGTVENALRNATALAYTQRLETRISALETALNIQSPPPSVPEAAASSAAEDAALTPSTPSGKGNTSPTKDSLTGLRLVDIRFSVRPDYPFYVGISPGVISTAGDVYLGVQAGYDGLVGPLGPVTRLTFNGGNRELRFSADVLAKAELLVNELRVYGGLGLGGTMRPEGNSLLLEAPFGGEYALTPRVGLFVQLITSYGFAPVSNIDAELSSGINLRF